MAGEFIEGVKSYGGLQATAVLEGDGLVAFDEFAKQHFLGKVGERITHVTAKGLEHVGYGPGPTHAPYDPDAPPRPRTVADAPEATGAESGAPKPSAEEPDVGADHEPPARTPMALPPELDKPAPRTKPPTAEQAPAGKEHSQGPEEPPKRTRPAEETREPADSDLDTHETALTPEMERQMRRDAEMARRAEQHPLDEASLRSSTAPTRQTRVLAAEFAPLFERFKTVKDVVPRNHELAEIVRRRLAAEGVYEVRVVPGTVSEGARAEFSVVDWEITISSQLLAKESMTIAEFSSLIEAATHEARHALHHWRGLRAALQEGQFRSDSMVKPYAPAVEAARAANASNAPEHRFPSEEARLEALEVYQQTFGKELEKGRGKIIDDLAARRTELLAAKEAAEQAEKLPRDSTQRQAAELAAGSAYRRWREAYNRYIKLPQETDAFRRGMAMQAAVAESLLIPRIEAARQAARDATREQVEARRSGDSKEAPAAKTRHDQAVAESQALTAELNNLPHRTGQRTTLEQDLAFAREVRDQARREAEHAQRVGDEPARQEAIARFREAAQEIREIQQEIANRARAPR